MKDNNHNQSLSTTTILDNIIEDLENEIKNIEKKWEFIKDPYKEISGLRKAIEIVKKYCGNPS